MRPMVVVDNSPLTEWRKNTVELVTSLADEALSSHCTKQLMAIRTELNDLATVCQVIGAKIDAKLSEKS